VRLDNSQSPTAVVQVVIKQSKTDPLRREVIVYLEKSGKEFVSGCGCFSIFGCRG